jgi:hypothetical protein
MDNGIGPDFFENLPESFAVENIDCVQWNPALSLKVLHIAPLNFGIVEVIEIVQQTDFSMLAYQRGSEVIGDESGAAGYQNTHESPLGMPAVYPDFSVVHRRVCGTLKVSQDGRGVNAAPVIL